MSLDEEEFARRLRAALSARHLSVDPAPDALERVHAGAQRRRRRRMASGAAAVAVVVLAGGTAAGVALRPAAGGPNHTVAAASDSSAPADMPSHGSPSHGSLSPAPTLKSPSLAPPDPGRAAGDRFNPVSVSAVSVQTYWVLGYRTTTTADGTTTTSQLLHTGDGGASFTVVGQPPFVLAQAPISRPPGVPLVTDVRFATAKIGWAYGKALYQTSDGGATWRKVSQVPGGVVDLVAASGVAWAVVDLSYDPASAGTMSHYALYSTPYGNGETQHWTRVALPFDLGRTTPSIVDQDGTVTLLASGPLRPGDRDHALIAEPGQPFTDHVGPCFQELGGYLSNSAGAVWALCPTGHAASVAISTDRGASWQPIPGAIADPGAGGLTAIDADHAIVLDLSANGTLLRLRRDGPPQPVGTPANDVAGAAFIGFTNPSTGFAILAHHDASTANDLLRTTDGGLHWSPVALTP